MTKKGKIYLKYIDREIEVYKRFEREWIGVDNAQAERYANMVRAFEYSKDIFIKVMEAEKI